MLTTDRCARHCFATASEIVQRISAEEWSASEVLEAYISRAAIAQRTANCLTEGTSANISILGLQTVRSADHFPCSVSLTAIDTTVT